MVSVTAERPPVKSTRDSLKNPLSLAVEVEAEPVAEDYGNGHRAPVKPRVLRYTPATSTLTLMVTTGRKVVETAYSVEKLACDFGTGYQLTKHVGHPGGQSETYSVHFSADGDSCDCAGGSYSTPRTGRPCKHLAALSKLRTLGTI